MALVGDELGDAIKGNLVAEFTIPPANQAELDRWCEAVGNAIVDYLKSEGIDTPPEE